MCIKDVVNGQIDGYEKRTCRGRRDACVLSAHARPEPGHFVRRAEQIEHRGGDLSYLSWIVLIVDGAECISTSPPPPPTRPRLCARSARGFWPSATLNEPLMCARSGVVGARICFAGTSAPTSNMTTGMFKRNAEAAIMRPSWPPPSRGSCQRVEKEPSSGTQSEENHDED